MTKQPTKTLTVLWIAALILLTGLALLARPALALPPRPTPTETAVHSGTGDIGQLELLVHFAPNWASSGIPWQELWTVVQWQDADGSWHVVEGWQGHLDLVMVSDGFKMWGVKEEIGGRGPFRWLVYRSEGGRLMAQSETFHLPGPNEILIVELDIAAE